ncbi:cell division protein FtsK, partial [Streptomyces sp. SR27]|nr:cell division protein FtsK [Streptomyces sp. SR27]
MASRTSGKGSQGTAGTAKPRAGRTTGAAKKAAPAKSPVKPPAKKAAAKKAAPAKRAPARKTAAKKAPPRPAPSPTGGVYRLARGAWLGVAHGVGAMFRGIGRGAKGLDPAHRKDGLALLLLGLALIVAAGTWSNLRGPVGDLVEMLVTGSFGRLDLLVPLLLGAIGIRLILYPEKPEANGRISIGLSALVIGVLGQVHIACGSPGRGDGSEAMQDAGGLIGWAASQPLVFMMGEVLAVPMLVLLTLFGLLVVTATPVNAIPQRLRALGARLGIVEPAYDPAEAEGYAGAEEDGRYEEYDEEWRDARPQPRSARPTRRRGPAEPYDVDRAEAEMLDRRKGAAR